jgi:uncharacterized membrane protein
VLTESEPISWVTFQSGKKLKERLLFIDAMRAVAILMMLQGHFVDSLLHHSYKDTANPIFNAWAFFRGITPSLFFTVSGLVFVYLLLKKDAPFLKHPRVIKGARRVLHLLFWGYFLRLFIFGVFQGEINPSFFAIDVLHCIGIALLSILVLFGLHKFWDKIPFAIYLIVGSLAIFLLYPTYNSQDYSALPTFFASYFTKEFGSVFTPFPWVGYALFGGFVGAVFHANPKFTKSYWAVAFFVGLGLVLHEYSSYGLMKMYQFTAWENFKSIAYNNFIFIRLGHVLVMIGGFILLEKLALLGKANNTFLRIGQETLMIYKVHFIVLYGTWFGIGLVRAFGGKLAPVPVVIGAVLFVFSFILLIHFQAKWDSYLTLQQRKAKILYQRSLPVIQHTFYDFLLFFKNMNFKKK